MISVAIDGPAGAGKSTIARAVSAALGFLYVDTGALYRTIALFILRAGVDPADREAVASLLPQIHIRLAYQNGVQEMYLGEENVSGEIRTPAVSMAASAVAAQPEVRAFLLEEQRRFAKEANVLMDGRDIGTVVLPDATVKIFLTASAEVRARRRYKELIEKGEKVSFEEVLRDVEARDYADSHRAVAPLKQASDAVLADTGALTLEESVELIKKIITEKTASM